MLKAVEWKQHRLFIVDQSKLPARVTKTPCRSAQQVVEAIRSRRLCGASALGVAAGFAVYLGVIQKPMAKTHDKLLQQINKLCELLAKSQPTSMNLLWALERMKRCAQNNRDHKLNTLRDILLREALNIQREEDKVTKAISGYGPEMIRDGDTILTCGNTGALSSGGSGTALGMIKEASAARRDLHVLLCESRPGLYGARQAAMELKQAKIPFQLITDNMAAYLMKKGMIDVLLVGAERITMNGDVAAEIGTYSLALSAYYHNLSCYVAAPVSAFDRNLLTGDLVPIEERHPEELFWCNGKSGAKSTIKAFYPAFDVTPHKYISALITELGVVRAPYDQNLRNLLATMG
ncbi:MAG: S-methyl-5-thioribose-1-phosphate isomerase [candidate division FCPU426 bacterium]